MLQLLALLMAAAEGVLRATPDLAALRLDARERLDWERAQIAAHAAGDLRGFEALYRAYAAAVYARVLLPALREPALAEDALADTFVRAHQNMHSFRSHERSVYFWLVRIAKNRAFDTLRRHSMQRRAVAGIREHFAHLGVSDPDPETALSLRGEELYLGARVAQILAAINPRYRQAIELRFFEEKTRDECAQRLAVKLATFDVLLLRALRAFRQQWETTRP